MGKSSPRAPAAPDPTATANAQAAANVQAARTTAALNRVNQYTPFGSVTYQNVGEEELNRRLTDRYNQYQAGTYRPDYGVNSFGAQIQEGWRGDIERENLMRELGTNADRWESRVNIDPRLQGAIDNVYGILGTPIDPNSAGASRDAAANAMLQRVNPQMEQQRNALDTRLRNQGLTPGSEAWQNAWREYGMQENDMRLAIDSQAENERSRALQNMLTMRQAPLNEVLALMNGTQVGGGNGGGVNVAPADITSAIGMNQAAQQQAYQGKVANQQGNNAAAAAGVGAAASIAAAAIIA